MMKMLFVSGNPVIIGDSLERHLHSWVHEKPEPP